MHRFAEAFNHTWALVVDTPVWTVVLGVFVYICGLLWEHRGKEKEPVMAQIGSLLKGVKWPALAFALIFFVEFTYLTPERMVKKERDAKEAALKDAITKAAEIEKLKKGQRIQVDVTGVADEQVRGELRSTRGALAQAKEQIEAAETRIRQLETGRRLLLADREVLIRSLAAINPKGKVAIFPSLNDEPMEYASALREVFKTAGFEVVPFVVDEKLPAITWGFTGERLIVADVKKPAPLAAAIQRSFLAIGRTMSGQSDPDVALATPEALIIAVGGGP